MLKSLKPWLDHFVQNKSHTGDIAWDKPDTLTEDERQCIKRSIAAFQLGEHSEGKGLLRAAEGYATECGNEHLVAITRLFIAEEQNHALLLKRFMTRHGIELLKKNWTDSIFRRLRKNVGFELSITVLITAEIISLVYYKALKSSTESGLLKTICDKILADETAHVRYESEIINCIREGHTPPGKRLAGYMQRFLFSGTVTVVYFSHKPVLNRGGFRFTSFRAACWSEFKHCFAPEPAIREGSRKHDYLTP